MAEFITYPDIVNASKTVTTSQGCFVDGLGRQIVLRGINFAGDAKMPTRPKYTPSHAPDDDEFYDGDAVSFVGSPFALDEVDEHLDRLRAWGFNTLRYIFTWEALEHQGPGIYDEEFIEYTIAMLYKIRAKGFRVIMDPHQDVWARYCGGSGAPMWTLYAAGLDPAMFRQTQAAILESHFANPDRERPKMLWSSNYTRLACATMFTLFFGGRDFAPKCTLNGQNIQNYLQDHFINAVCYLAHRIHKYHPQLTRGNSTILGWESINEPGEGYLGIRNICSIPKHQQVKLFHAPTAAQAMALGSGYAQDSIAHFAFTTMGPRQTGTDRIDPGGVSAWLTPERAKEIDSHYGWTRGSEWTVGECIWKLHGVWDLYKGAPVVKQSHYFSHDKMGKRLNTKRFVNANFTEHWLDYSRALRKIINADTLLFLQPPVLVEPPELLARGLVDKYTVYTPHYYDGLTLMQKHWNTKFNVDALGVLRSRYRNPPVMAVRLGERNIRSCFAQQLLEMKREGVDALGPDVPMFMSEIGIPYDLDNKQAYRTGDFSAQTRALDANHFALERAGLSYSLWVYSGRNTNKYGDGWNGEDLSVWSRDKVVGGEVYNGVTHCPASVAEVYEDGAKTPVVAGTEAETTTAIEPSRSRDSSKTSSLTRRASTQIFRRASAVLLPTSTPIKGFKGPLTAESNFPLYREQHHKNKHKHKHDHKVAEPNHKEKHKNKNKKKKKKKKEKVENDEEKNNKNKHHHHHKMIFVAADAVPSSGTRTPDTPGLPLALQKDQVHAELEAQAVQHRVAEHDAVKTPTSGHNSPPTPGSIRRSATAISESSSVSSSASNASVMSTSVLEMRSPRRSPRDRSPIRSVHSAGSSAASSFIESAESDDYDDGSSSGNEDGEGVVGGPSTSNSSVQSSVTGSFKTALEDVTGLATDPETDLDDETELDQMSAKQAFHDPCDYLEGARAPEAFIRPYPVAVAGRLCAYGFDMKGGVLTVRVEGSAQTVPSSAVRGLAAKLAREARHQDTPPDKRAEIVGMLRKHARAERKALRKAERQEEQAARLRERETKVLLRAAASSGSVPAHEFLQGNDHEEDNEDDLEEELEDDDEDDESVFDYFSTQDEATTDAQFAASPYNSLHLVPTVIFLPTFHFPCAGTAVAVSAGLWRVDRANQLLYWWHLGGPQELEVRGVGVDRTTYIVNSVAALRLRDRAASQGPNGRNMTQGIPGAWTVPQQQQQQQQQQSVPPGSAGSRERPVTTREPSSASVEPSAASKSRSALSQSRSRSNVQPADSGYDGSAPSCTVS
ncbi:uncharacterized protein SAPINGB_P000793 [Magnusiomyces paraingens]|uniref:Glycoside hydrolase family 5 domain-containing protein n=1 Tax=Magnusiomyces paraingens TaxID=2606893 RepID=A0A5E8B276_9ASCO|nr:uncharacterized protein SAPINGB_P000793 [Saprochaete ingens]VVT45565.1 unnamed protein product [Saprochaete ingens]